MVLASPAGPLAVPGLGPAVVRVPGTLLEGSAVPRMARLTELVVAYGLHESGNAIPGGLSIKWVAHSFLKYRKADSEKVNVDLMQEDHSSGGMFGQMIYLVGLGWIQAFQTAHLH